MTDGLFVLDENGIVTMMNQRFIELSDLETDKELIGTHISEDTRRWAALGRYGDGDAEVLAAARDQELLGPDYVERDCYLDNGRILSIRKSPVEGGGAVITSSDVTKLRESERILKLAKTAAEDQSKSKSDFLAVVSHEVRTPMNGVIGLAQILAQRTNDLEQKKYLDTIISSARSLVRILDDLLDVSKLEGGHLSLETVPFIVVDLIEQCAAVMGPEAEKKNLGFNVDVHPDVPAVVAGDPFRLRQIIFNLLSNAVKFTRKGDVSLTVRSLGDGKTEDTQRIELAVSDTGPGIDDRMRERLFAPYEQGAASTARHYGGTGLGLTICRRLATLMGGGIELESDVGKGSTFKVELELAVIDADDVVELRENLAELGGADGGH